MGTHDPVRLPFAAIPPTLAQMSRSMAVFFVTLFWGGFAAVPSVAASGGLGLDAKQVVVCLADNTSMTDRPASYGPVKRGPWFAEGR